MLLDKRIHRTVRLGAELSKSAAYSVKVTSSGNVNTLTIVDKTTNNILVSVACPNIFTPPATGTPIANIYNSNTQVPMDPTADLSVFRIYELHQVLNQNGTGKPTLIIRATNATGLPDDATSTLHYTPAGAAAAAAETVIPLGDKIPPNLG